MCGKTTISLKGSNAELNLTAGKFSGVFNQTFLVGFIYSFGLLAWAYIYKNDTSIKAIVIDQEISDIKLTKLPIFKFSETENIGNFILEYFKR